MAELDPADVELNICVHRIQAALSGRDMQTALNALAITLGTYAVLGAETKGDALGVARAARDQARKTIEDNWGRPDLEALRAQMRGVVN